MTVADGEGAFERGVIVTQDATSSVNAKRARRPRAFAPSRMHRITSGRRDDDDQDDYRADQNVGPFPRGDAGGLQLIQVLRKLMQVLIGELRQFLIHLLLRESTRREDFRDLRV